MEIGQIIPHIEALIFASDRPLTAMDITELINNAFGFMEDKITMEQVSTCLEGIVEKYQAEFYPFEMRESGGGWQFLTKKDFHKTVAQLNGEKFLKRLSTASLETLAIIAYKQPITKGDVEAIRGVSCDYSVQKLLEKELIIITGRNEDMPGKPLVYTTSKTFMDYFGLNSPEDLPKLKEIFEEAMVSPTTISEDENAGPENKQSPEENKEEVPVAPMLVVSETGELIEETHGTGEDLNNETPDLLSEDLHAAEENNSTASEEGEIEDPLAENETKSEEEEAVDEDESTGDDLTDDDSSDEDEGEENPQKDS